MAKYSKGILGPVRGTVGTVVGSSWRAIDYVRSKASGFNDKNSPLQKEKRKAFRRHALAARALLPAARVGLKGLAVRATEYNVLVKRLYAVDGDLSLLRLSSGVGPMVEGLAVAREGVKVKVTWTAPAEAGKDVAHVAIVCKDEAYAATVAVGVGAGEAAFELPSANLVLAHAYAFRAGEHGERVSDTAVATPKP